MQLLNVFAAEKKVHVFMSITHVFLRRPVLGLMWFVTSGVILSTRDRWPERVTQLVMFGCCVCHNMVRATGASQHAREQHETPGHC